MSELITIEFPDGERKTVSTNAQTSQYEDIEHNGEWYNINDSRLKIID